MFIGTRSPLPPGTACKLDVKLKDGYRLVSGLGEVAWTRDRAQGPDRPPGMGVRFRELDETSRDLVFEIVDRRLVEGGRVFQLDSAGEPSDQDIPDLEEMLRRAEQRRSEGPERILEDGVEDASGGMADLFLGSTVGGAEDRGEARQVALPWDVEESEDAPGEPAAELLEEDELTTGASQPEFPELEEVSSVAPKRPSKAPADDFPDLDQLLAESQPLAKAPREPRRNLLDEAGDLLEDSLSSPDLSAIFGDSQSDADVVPGAAPRSRAGEPYIPSTEDLGGSLSSPDLSEILGGTGEHPVLPSEVLAKAEKSRRLPDTKADAEPGPAWPESLQPPAQQPPVQQPTVRQAPPQQAPPWEASTPHPPPTPPRAPAPPVFASSSAPKPADPWAEVSSGPSSAAAPVSSSPPPTQKARPSATSPGKLPIEEMLAGLTAEFQDDAPVASTVTPRAAAAADALETVVRPEQPQPPRPTPPSAAASSGDVEELELAPHFYGDPKKSAGRGRLLVLLVVLLLAVAAFLAKDFLPFLGGGAPTPVAVSPALPPAGQKAPVAGSTDPGQDAGLAEGAAPEPPSSAEPERVVVTPDGEGSGETAAPPSGPTPTAATGTGDRAAAAAPSVPPRDAPSTASSGASATGPPVASSKFTKILSLAWDRTDRGTRVTLVGDGGFPQGSYTYVSITEGTPRLLIRLSNVVKGGHPAQLRVGTRELQAIRTGYHPGRPGQDLHVVLDFTSPRVVVESVEAEGDRLVISVVGGSG
jgi:hypothetical protein